MWQSALSRYARAGLVGFSGGACVGLVGWGGAQFIIPGMTMMGHSQLAATGISLCSLSLSTVTGAAKFVASDNACLATAAAMALPSVITARIGTRMAARIPDQTLQLAFNGASLLLIPTHFLVQRNAVKQAAALEADAATACPATGDLAPTACPTTAQRPVSLSAAELLSHGTFGCLSGVISAVMGVGGLPLTMSYLTAFTSLPHHDIQGTAVLAVAPSAMTSAISRLHVVPKGTMIAVATGAMAGAMVGASVALRTSEARLRELYMASLVVLGGRSFVSAGINLRNLRAARR